MVFCELLLDEECTGLHVAVVQSIPQVSHHEKLTSLYTPDAPILRRANFWVFVKIPRDDADFVGREWALVTALEAITNM